MKLTRPLCLSILLAVAAGSPGAGAAPQNTAWSGYERSTPSGRTSSPCLEWRRGRKGAGAERKYVFQVFNDCNRPVRAVCDVDYTPGCSYAGDLAPAAHLDAAIDAHGESSVFGGYAPITAEGVPGCFFARCSEAGSDTEPTR